MIDEDKPIEVCCQFCGKKYSFSVPDLSGMLEKAARP